MTGSDAERLFREAVELHQRGRLREAAERYADARGLHPRDLRVLVNHGAALQALGDAGAALAAFDAARAIATGNPDIEFNRGCALRALGRHAEALDGFDRALALRPDDPEALVNRANVLLELRRADEALVSAERAVALAPDAAPAHDAAGRALRGLRRTETALRHFNRAIELAPVDADFAFNRASALFELRRFDDALAGFALALKLAPDRIDALGGRGEALKALGRLDEAITAFAAAEATPGTMPRDRQIRDAALSQLVMLLRQTCRWSDGRAAEHRLLRRVVEPDAAVDSFVVLAITDEKDLLLRAARGHWRERLGSRAPVRWPPRPAGDRLRIGYLSYDFREHAVAHQIAGVFEHHDRARYEIHGYSYGRDDGSAVRQRIAEAFERFVDVRAEPDPAIAARIAGSGIDVLVDLTGHTQGSRTELLALRPAPVCAQFLGFPGTLGSEAVDYAIVDEVVVRPDEESAFAEKLAWLPHSYMVSDDSRPLPGRFPARADCGLPADGFVFCCFNNTYKFTAPVFDVWMRLLRALPSAVLWLPASRFAEANLRREAQARGVAPERIVFAPRVTREEHFARLALADLFLDTRPYNAHATASDALWAGVPVLTCPGDSFASRVAASLLRTARLPELVAASLEEYETIALGLAREKARLAALRERLAEGRTASKLFDAGALARNLERAYATMVETHRRGEMPRSFRVG